MSALDFVELFGRKKKNPVVPLGPGMDFPYPCRAQAAGMPIYCCFVSFLCPTCMDLLPELKTINDQTSLNFYLFTNGTDEENNRIVEFFGYDFPVIRIEDSEYKTTYYIKETPYLYVLSGAGKVKDGRAVNTGAELRSFIELHSSEMDNA